jgi:mannose-6-phosphate isomerase-like protein (cupin superfamily)
MRAVDLDHVFGGITTYWDPHIAGELNGQYVKCAKLKGKFVWHKHESEDELFLVHRGVLHMRLRDGVITISEGQFYIVGRGVEHQPYAPDEVEVVLFEPASTLNTGDVRNEFHQRPTQAYPGNLTWCWSQRPQSWFLQRRKSRGLRPWFIFNVT